VTVQDSAHILWRVIEVSGKLDLAVAYRRNLGECDLKVSLHLPSNRIEAQTDFIGSMIIYGPSKVAR
jgi:hypothetical protein